MAGWRVGVAIKPEKTFGMEDTTSGEKWHYVGIGMDMQVTQNNNWNFQNGIGSKTPQMMSEGRFTGTWTGNLYLDYNNFYWLLFGLEEYAFRTETHPTQDSPNEDRPIGVHMFTTSNKKSLKSFSMRFLKLDREVGGDFDEKTVYLGCTMNNVSPSYESSNSAIKCSISGSFVDTILTAVNLPDTFDSSDTIGSNNVRQVDWGCLEVLNENGTKWEKVANNERTSYKFSRTIRTVPECGERIDSGYFESAIQPITISALVYSRNPNQWQTRMHTGGVRNDISVGDTSRPREKGLEPIPNIRIASGTPAEGSNIPDYLCYAYFENVSVDSWGNTYNATSEITESPSLRAMKGRVIFKTPDVTNALLPSGDYDAVVNVTYDFENGDTADLVMPYPANDTIEIIDYKGTKEGYTFGGWSISSSTLKAGDSYKIGNTDITLTAIWTANTESESTPVEPTEPTEPVTEPTE